MNFQTVRALQALLLKNVIMYLCESQKEQIGEKCYSPSGNGIVYLGDYGRRGNETNEDKFKAYVFSEVEGIIIISCEVLQCLKR